MLPKSLLLCCRGDWRLCCWKTCLKIRSRSTEPKSLAWVKVTGSAKTCRKNSQNVLLQFVTAIISSKSLNWFVFFNCYWKISLFFYNCSLTRVHFYLNFIFDTLTREFGWNVFYDAEKVFLSFKRRKASKTETSTCASTTLTHFLRRWRRFDVTLDCVASNTSNMTFCPMTIYWIV